MAKIEIPGLVIKRRGKKTYHYWQPSATLKKAGWLSIPLGTDLRDAMRAAEAQNDKIEQWRSGGAKPRTVKKYIKGGTMDQLLDRYRSERLPQLGLKTQNQQRSVLSIIQRWAGPEQLAHIDRTRVRKLRDVLMKPDKEGEVKHHRAAATMRILHSLLQWGIDNGLLPEDTKNPAANQKVPTPPSRDQSWSTAAMDLMTQAALDEGQPGLALALHLGREVGQREEDILLLSLGKWIEIPRHKLNPEDFERLAEPGPDGTLSVWGIRLRQGKTRIWVEIPIVGQTRRLMEQAADQARRIGSTLLLHENWIPTHFRDRTQLERQLEAQCREQGIEPTEPTIAAMFRDSLVPRPWHQTRFQRAVQRIRATAVDKALANGEEELATEIADLQFRDLRRTAVIWLGELGIEDHLIASITGHQLDHTRKILETYMPRTTKMAGKAIALRSERSNVTPIERSKSA
ncbi:hypothetical protein FIM10_01970 [Sphingomonadales bacterium 56]|uniref:hypothetical protein n=1 Tax=unclassified Sphingobium TaxID=2611147 RepID=UPI00191B1089|nr:MULTISPECIES: hypothetical protein [unclassified Sphingobium]MBY2927450.1 hypothetical protein [Sphingomonadales bacterium 56]MBY2957518.1 hypothetical protein [Sphingomonadales bacterium 58]MBY2957561.1 hypothetical protein [Sphingomonadales bacterium 58]CAD7335227.1 hypothetical protein SPHS8_00401 [Sphingobium sp. S8]CAD7335246.1 hypothetical protein SPHS6_00401 [Sphingobium sp. S6]